MSLEKIIVAKADQSKKERGKSENLSYKKGGEEPEKRQGLDFVEG